ncbi:MAG TPA: hypothetical protein VFB82_00830 [Blastocatellia bacterium]|nr:hypothetical protein [Blastocatellia bacterium]
MSYSKETTIESVYAKLTSGHEIRVRDRQEMGLFGWSIEDALNQLVRTKGVLLHGTGQRIPAGSKLRLSKARPRPGSQRVLEGFATDNAGVAILKALFTNQTPVGGTRTVNLKYPMHTSDDSPLWLEIQGWHPNVEREHGYVYIFNSMRSFEKEGDTWQWVTSNDDVTFGGCMEVIRSDFRYPVNRA